MHSWIFRNRTRLQPIYGRRYVRPLPERPQGRVERRGHEVVLVPAKRAA